MAAVAVAAAVFTGCSSDDDFLTPYEESAIQTRAMSSTNAIINFDNASENVMASDQYGANLYSATADGNQVTTGYIARIGETDTYIQFPINYLKQEWVTGQPWQYEYWNGGFAISNFHNMTQGDYQNQCSVYLPNGGHSGNNFAVAFGYSDSYNDSQTTYDKCAKIYLTDSTGYKVTIPNRAVTGMAKTGRFNSLWVCNTTYAYLVMKDGNSFTSAIRVLYWASFQSSICPTTGNFTNSVTLPLVYQQTARRSGKQMALLPARSEHNSCSSVQKHQISPLAWNSAKMSGLQIRLPLQWLAWVQR